MESNGSCSLTIGGHRWNEHRRGLTRPESRAEAVKLVEATGLSVARAAKQLSMPKSSRDNWVRASREGKLAEVGKGQRLPSELELDRRVANTLGASARRDCVHKRMPGWKSRSRRRTSERGRPSAPSDCKPTSLTTASRWAFIASNALVRNSAYAVSRNGNSRLIRSSCASSACRLR